MTTTFEPPQARAPEAPGEPTPRPAVHARSRFLSGVALGAVVGALVAAGVAGGIVAVVDDGGSASSPPPATAAEPAPGTTVPSANVIDDTVASTRPSIVAIHDSIAQTDIFGRDVEGQAAGTGFVLTDDGYIVTNDHVIDAATDITVDFADRTGVPADVVAADPGSDLAVLHVNRTGLTPLPLGESAALHVGDPVVAIGNALDLSGEPTVTTGIVSATGRSLTEPNGEHLSNLLQTDTAINPGNSGGPLLDLAGNVVGINTAVAGQAQNIGFAIAITPARRLIEQLEAGRVPQHALLGVSTRPAVENEQPSGAEVVRVSPDSAAEDAGLRAGDVITRVDDTRIATPDDLGVAIAGHQPGDTVTVTYVRDGAEHHGDAELGARDVGNS